MTDSEENQDVGRCCACHKNDETVRTVILLNQRAPVAGTGWGCVVCDLPQDGAVAVLCDECVENEREPVEVVLGYLAQKNRVNRALLLNTPFDHDPAKHAADPAAR